VRSRAEAAQQRDNGEVINGRDAEVSERAGSAAEQVDSDGGEEMTGGAGDECALERIGREQRE
jgi:hypothetical protein